MKVVLAVLMVASSGCTSSWYHAPAIVPSGSKAVVAWFYHSSSAGCSLYIKMKDGALIRFTENDNARCNYIGEQVELADR